VCVYINKRPRRQDVIELDEAGLAIVVINLLNTLVEEREVSRPTRCQRTQPITAERSLLDEVTECLGADQQRIESLVRSVDATKKTYHSKNKYHTLYHCLSKLLLLYHKVIQYTNLACTVNKNNGTDIQLQSCAKTRNSQKAPHYSRLFSGIFYIMSPQHVAVNFYYTRLMASFPGQPGLQCFDAVGWAAGRASGL